MVTGIWVGRGCRLIWGRNARLDRIGEVFDWRALEALVAEVYSARTGRPIWPPLLLFRALLLQIWYGLSDLGREEALGVKDRILHRRHENQPRLPHWQAVRNTLISPIRAAVERVFGTMKRGHGYRRVRYRGLAAPA